MALFYRLYEVLQQALSADADVVGEAHEILAGDGIGAPAFKQWLDVDRAVEEYCADQRLAVPTEIDEVVELHIMAIDNWLNHLKGGEA